MITKAKKGEHKKLCYEQVKREYNVRKKCCSCFHDKVGRFMFNLDCAWRSLPVITIHYLEISHSQKSKSNPNSSSRSTRLTIKAHMLAMNSFKFTLRRTVQTITESRTEVLEE